MGAQALSLWEFALLEPTASEPTTSLRNFNGSLFRIVLYCVASVLLAALTADDDRIFHIAMCCMSGVLVCCERRHWALGLIAVTLPFRTWLQLAPGDFASTISVLLVVWNCDTGALVMGRLTSKLGLSRLPIPTWIHRISPAKSTEGFIGGILGGTWTSVSWVPMLIQKASLETTAEFDVLWGSHRSRLLLGLVLSLLAILGDLFESAIKRQSRSKDSGSMLPGHGGILDRFDSSLLAVLFYQCLLKR
jgi:CDP-diglyceride synthetase